MPCACHHSPVLIRDHFWIHKEIIFWKKLLENKERVFKSGENLKITIFIPKTNNRLFLSAFKDFLVVHQLCPKHIFISFPQLFWGSPSLPLWGNVVYGWPLSTYLRLDLVLSWINSMAYFKGQLISKCLLGVIVWTKIPTKFFPGFLP